MAGWLRKTKIKERKKLRPFRRFDDAGMGSGLSSFEKFINFMLVCIFIIIVVYGVLAVCGINH